MVLDVDRQLFRMGLIVRWLFIKRAAQQLRVILHNDAVVQGLSEVPRMADCKAWAAVTIGTGLGNASFVNKKD